MHFVTGGAYNGKAKWVKKYYSLDDDCVQWISAYRGENLPLHFQAETVVLQGIETWIKRDIDQQNPDAAKTRYKWKEMIEQWRIWEEKKHARRLVLLGADITKGIVPIDMENRIWRDAAGWVFQDIVAASSRVDVIWYGLSQQLK